MKDPTAIDRSLRAALNPGERVAIIDFEPAPGSQPPPSVPANRTGHGILPAIVVRELTEAGLTPVRTIPTWPEDRLRAITFSCCSRNVEIWRV